MGRKETSKRAAPIISSAANPAASSTTQSATNSSFLRSCFCPSKFQLSLFASVIQSFESQHLRIHDTTSGRLRCEHALGSRASITCLEWGSWGGEQRERSHSETKKKRKRHELLNGDNAGPGEKDVAIVFGTNDSEIHIFSPSESKVTMTLRSVHTNGVRDFKFTDIGGHAGGWSIGGDGMLVQWNLKKGMPVR